MKQVPEGSVETPEGPAKAGPREGTDGLSPIPPGPLAMGEVAGATAVLRDWARGLLEELLPVPGVDVPPSRMGPESFTEGFDLSPAMWKLVTERAWRDPVFQGQVARSFRRHLRAHHAFAGTGEAPDDGPARLHPATFWISIELITVPTVGAAAEPLRSIARAGYEHEGWATFLDQWFIAHALEHSPDAIRHAPDRLLALLRELPLLRDPRHRELRGQLQDRTKGMTAALELGQAEREIRRPMWYRSTRRTPSATASKAREDTHV